jgi:hypothetical protein
MEFLTRSARPLFDSSSLESILQHPSWQEVNPNYPLASALIPKDLTAKDLSLIIEALGEGSPLTKVENSPNFQCPKVFLENGLSLALYRIGGSKWCYLLTDESGKKMAIHLGGYSTVKPFPEDPRISLVNPGLGKSFYSFSDLRTYLVLPVYITTEEVEAPSSLAIQEWGGEKSLQEENPWLKDLRQQLAAARAKAYIRTRGYRINSETESELRHLRHYLLNRGNWHLPAVIDIPCEQRR